VDLANRLAAEVPASSRLNDSKGPSSGQIQHSPEPQPHQGLAGTSVGAGGVGLAAAFLAFEAFFFVDFLAAGFFAVDFLADLAPFFFGDFLTAGLAAFFFLAIADDSFASKRPSHSGRLSRGRYRTVETIVVANGVHGDAALVIRAGIVSSLAESSQGETALKAHVRLGGRKQTIAQRHIRSFNDANSGRRAGSVSFLEHS
jgi:hypothetical protein